MLYSAIIKNTNNMYSLDCPYFEKYFKTVNELISYIIESGMDPNYEITWEDDGIGELAIDYISFLPFVWLPCSVVLYSGI